MVGELRGGARRARVGERRVGLEVAHEPLVEPAAGAREQLALDRLAQQLVPEAASHARRLELQDAAVEGRVQAGIHVRIGRLEHERRAAARRPGAPRRPRRRRRPGSRVQPPDPGQEDLHERVGRLAAADRRRRELLDEQRVALRAEPDPVGQPGAGAPPAIDPELAIDAGAVQPPEVDDRRRRHARDLGQPGEDRVAARQVVLAAGQRRSRAARR